MVRRVVSLWIVLIYVSTAIADDKTSRVLDNIRLGQEGNRTRVVFDLSGPAEHQLMELVDPPGVIVNIHKTSVETSITVPPLTGTPINNITVKEQDEDALIVELSLAVAADYKFFSLKPDGSKGNRLVLDVYPSADNPQNSAEATIGPTIASRGEPEGSAIKSGAIAQRQSNEGIRKAKRVSFSGTWEQEWAIETDGADGQKFEALIEPRFDLSLAERTSLTAIARIRLDTVGDLGPDQNRPDNYSSINGPFLNDSHGELSLRELYLDTEWGDTYWRVGKQQVVWGQADGIKVLDVVNPQTFREFILDDFDDSRIPLTMLNMQSSVSENITLQLLWIPDTTYHELAESGTPYFITSPKLVPVAPKEFDVEVLRPDVPDDFLDDSDLGGRISAYIGGWDVTVNYLYHYQDFPIFYQSLESNPPGIQGRVTPEYERNKLLGSTISNAFGDFTLRGEFAYSSDTFHPTNDLSSRGIEDSSELASVLGLDWQLSKYDTFLSVQWFQSHLFDYKGSIRRDETEHNVSMFYQRDFANETWHLEGLLLYSPNEQDWLMQLQLKYFWLSNLEVWLGADIFSGDREGLYGQFRDRDRLLLGIKLGF